MVWGTSNIIIANGEKCLIPYGLHSTNFIDDLEIRFKHKIRKKPLQHIVIHETAGNYAINCKQTLARKGYGVHLIISRSGLISNHGDLLLDVMTHANQCNPTSIGIEVVNPYAPSLTRIAHKTVPAEWWTWCKPKNDRRYVLPTDAQIEALLILVPWLCTITKVPYTFPTIGLNAKQPKIKHWRLRKRPPPGIIAHRDFASHADGRYLLEHLYNNKII